MKQHTMRRVKQQLSPEDASRILTTCTNGILSLVDADGTPYGVPISYACDGNGHIYMHSARKGHKIDCIESDSRCSFCVVEQDHIVPEEFTTYFRSVIVTGQISVVTDADEIVAGLKCLCSKYCTGINPTAEINRFINAVSVLRLDIDHLTGKESIELVRQRH